MRGKHEPQRRCTGCGERREKGMLVRLAVTSATAPAQVGAQGVVTVDRGGKRGGRGAYLCHDPGCWKAGVWGRGVEVALRRGLSREEREGLILALRDYMMEEQAAPTLVGAEGPL